MKQSDIVETRIQNIETYAGPTIPRLGGILARKSTNIHGKLSSCNLEGGHSRRNRLPKAPISRSHYVHLRAILANRG